MTGATGSTRLVANNAVVGTLTAQCGGPGGPAAPTMGVAQGGDLPGLTSCPAGQVAIGIQGNEGDFVDLLTLRCRAADHTGPIALSAPSFGGAGGGADGPYDCPNGRALTGLTGELVFAATMVRYVQIACEAAAAVTPPTAQPAPAVPPPVLGEKMNVQTVSGKVLIALPAGATGARRVGASQKGLRFVPLEQVRQIPIGSFLDTSKGTARITTARDSAGTTQSGVFGAGLFQVLQSRQAKARGLTDLVLKGSSFRSCRAKKSAAAGAAARKAVKRTIRRLRGDAQGRFRTRGRYSAATVRGTVWTVTDRCDGTLTKVTRGSVVVRDLRRGRNVTVQAGKRTKGGGRGSYLAKAP